MPGLTRLAQIALTAALLCLLTFAASFAEVPRSEFAPVTSQAE